MNVNTGVEHSATSRPDRLNSARSHTNHEPLPGASRISNRSRPDLPPGQPPQRSYEVTIAMPCRLEAQAMEWMLASHGQIPQVRSVTDVDELLDHVNTDCPRILLLDEAFAGSDLLVICRQLPVRLKEIRIGLFADRLSSRQLDLAAGHVQGVLSRHCGVQVLLSELDTLAEGRLVVSEDLRSRVQIHRNKTFQVTMIDKVQRLTDRQLEVLIRIASGMSAKDTAHELHITEKAVESHKYRLMRTLNLGNRLELCRWAIREGIIPA